MAALPFVRFRYRVTSPALIDEDGRGKAYFFRLSLGVQSHTNKHKATACIIPSAYMAGSFIFDSPF